MRRIIINRKTKLTHSGHTADDHTGAVTTPTYQTGTYLQDDTNDLCQGYEHSRTANPTRSSVGSIITTPENGKHGFAFSSGIAATSTVIMLLDKGDHIILNSDIYGGTYRASTKVFARFGIGVDFTDTTHTDSIVQATRPTTKMLFIEAPSNPLLRATDIKKSVEIVKEHGLILVVDNMSTTPYYRNPLDLSIDIVLHSTMKYLGGHSDVAAGLVVISDDKLAKRLAFISSSAGSILGPQDNYLLVRGIKTLGLRMKQVNRSVIEIIKVLQAHPAAQQVLHPSIENHLNHDVHIARTDGHTGVITLEVKNIESIKQSIKVAPYCTLAKSLGAMENPISVPALMTHASIPADIRVREGVIDGLVRISAGIEDTEDLVDDSKQTLDIL